MTKFYCDKCKQLITDRRSAMVCKTGLLRDLGTLDWCPDCAAAFIGFLGGKAPAPPAAPRARGKRPAAAARADGDGAAAP